MKVAYDEVWTCAGSPVVSGYVITNFMRDWCHGLGAWQHRVAREGLWTCAGSPIPPGYRSTTIHPQGCNGIGAWFLARA